MAIRMTGLNSGLNTDSIVQALMSAQRTKQTKIKNKQTKLEWKQEKWAALNTKLYNFYKGPLSSMRFSKNYRTKAASSSNTTKVTANATVNASTGTYKVKVDSLASTQYVTSGVLKKAARKDDTGATVYDQKVTSKTKLSDIDGFAAEGTEIKISSGGKDVYLDVDKNTTVDDFLNACTTAGLSATFDEGQQRFFISSLKSGAANKFTITASSKSTDLQDAMKDFKDAVKYDYLSSGDRSAVDSIMTGLRNKTINPADVETRLQDIAKRGAENEASSKANRYYYELSAKEAIDDFKNNTGVTVTDASGNSKDLSVADQKELKEYIEKNVSGNYDIIKNAMANAGITLAEESSYSGSTDAEKAEAMANAVISARDSYISGKQTDILKNHKDNGDITAKIASGITNADLATIGITDTTSTPDKVATAALYTFENSTTRTQNAVDEMTATNSSGALSKYKSEIDNGSSLTDASDKLGVLGLANVDGGAVTEGTSGKNGMVVIDAKDTKVQFNGATLTSTDTNISVAGLELNLLSADPDEEVTITVTNDVSAIYDTVKEFLNEYNSILKELNTNYNAASSKDYDVLTDDQKDAMSDTEVEKWEAKIKDSLLRRDSTLGNLVSSMRNNMMGAFVGSDGKRYSLATLGIVTSGDYAEGGLLHIKGDEDDEEYSEENNVLMSMLQEDPDKVMEVLTHFSSTLYDDLQKKMSRSALSSALTFYNDKEMSSQLSDYKKEVSKWEIKLNDMEDRYYSQFTAMESALTKLQSQQSALSQYLGG